MDETNPRHPMTTTERNWFDTYTKRLQLGWTTVRASRFATFVVFGIWSAA